MSNLALLDEMHGDVFVEVDEPFIERLKSETNVNIREDGLTQVTDHAGLQPLSAPATRMGEWQQAYTDGPIEIADPGHADGAKTRILAGVRPDELQAMGTQEPYQLNTLRIEPEPWDERLIG